MRVGIWYKEGNYNKARSKLFSLLDKNCPAPAEVKSNSRQTRASFEDGSFFETISEIEARGRKYDKHYVDTEMSWPNDYFATGIVEYY